MTLDTLAGLRELWDRNELTEGEYIARLRPLLTAENVGRALANLPERILAALLECNFCGDVVGVVKAPGCHACANIHVVTSSFATYSAPATVRTRPISSVYPPAAAFETDSETPPPPPVPRTIAQRRGMHRCPTDGCGATAAVLQMSDDTLTLVWTFPQAREILGGPDETAMDTGVRLDDLDHGAFRCGYCAAPRLKAGR